MADLDKENLKFRSEAIDAFSKRSYGQPIARMPNSWFYLSFMLVVLIGVGIWFLTTSSYSRKETVVGWLAPEGGLARISVTQGGLLEQVLFEQGDYVKKGQTIFIISQDKRLIGGAKASHDALLKLEQERTEISKQIDIENIQRKNDLQVASEILVQLIAEQSHIEAQIVQQEERVAIQQEIFMKFERLNADNQTVSYLELQTQKERFVSQKQTLASLEQRYITMEREIILTQSKLKKRPLDGQNVIAEFNRRLIEISNRRTKTLALGGHAIPSQISGTIATMEIQVGNTVYPQQILASILPEKAHLHAEVYIPSRAIGFIQPGHAVRIKYAAFPYQRFGAATGSVLEISDTILKPEEIPTSIGLKEPAYKARIALDRQDMEGFSQVRSLRSGMVLQAEIILEKRSFLQWILEPLRARRTA